MVHGDAEAAAADEASARAFSGALGAGELAALEGSIPTTRVGPAQQPMLLTSALSTTQLTSSKSEGVRLIKQGGVSVNQQRVDDPDAQIGAGDAVGGRWILLQRGKKDRHLVVVEEDPQSS
jgi:tyrosyl-tRNA synthetase